jgi:hypothetical protein
MKFNELKKNLEKKKKRFKRVSLIRSLKKKKSKPRRIKSNFQTNIAGGKK